MNVNSIRILVQAMRIVLILLVHTTVYAIQVTLATVQHVQVSDPWYNGVVLC